MNRPNRPRSLHATSCDADGTLARRFRAARAVHRGGGAAVLAVAVALVGAACSTEDTTQISPPTWPGQAVPDAPPLPILPGLNEHARRESSSAPPGSVRPGVRTPTATPPRPRPAAPRPTTVKKPAPSRP